MCALAHLDNDWIQSKIRATGFDASNFVNAAEFDVYDTAGAKHTRAVTYSDVWNTPTDRQGEAW